MKKPTESAVIEMLRQHGYLYCSRKLRNWYKSDYLISLCYMHCIGGLPKYQYPQVLIHHLKQGQNPTDIAEQYGTSFSVVYRWMRRHKICLKPRAFSAEEDKYIRFNAGYISVPDMALSLKRHKNSIYHRMQILGVTITDAIGYTVQQLSDDIGVSAPTVRNWMRTQNLKPGIADGTYRIAVDEIELYEWLSAGHIYRIPKIRPDQYHLMEIKRECDKRLVSSQELSTFIAKSHLNPQRGFPHLIMTVKENGYGGIYERQAVYDFFWRNRRMLNLQKIPKSFTYWRDLCTQWDRQYIYRLEISQYLDYAAQSPWYAYETMHHNFPKAIGRGVKYYSRSAVLEWSRWRAKHPRLVKHLEQTTY